MAYVKTWQKMLSIAQNVKTYCASVTYLNYRSARTAIRYYCNFSLTFFKGIAPYFVFDI